MQIKYNIAVRIFSFFINTLLFPDMDSIEPEIVSSLKTVKPQSFRTYIASRYSMVIACALVAAPLGSNTESVFP